MQDQDRNASEGKMPLILELNLAWLNRSSAQKKDGCKLHSIIIPATLENMNSKDKVFYDGFSLNDTK